MPLRGGDPRFGGRRAVDGECHPYVLELILALRGQGWRWTEECI
jgi:hypothetical protein